MTGDKETAGLNKANVTGDVYMTESGKPLNIITASAVQIVKAGAGIVRKMIINSHTTGTFKLFDGTATNLIAIGGTYTPASGSSVIPLEVEFNTGIVVATAGTVDFTLLYH